MTKPVFKPFDEVFINFFGAKIRVPENYGYVALNKRNIVFWTEEEPMLDKNQYDDCGVFLGELENITLHSKDSLLEVSENLWRN